MIYKKDLSISTGGRSHHSATSRAMGTLIKLFVMNNSGVNMRKVFVTVASDVHVALHSGHRIKAIADGAFSRVWS